MEFYATCGKRPVRLSDKTRQFAFESLNHKYGQMTKEVSSVSLDDVYNFENLSLIEKYDVAIEHIANYAPIRICENELISGAATLSDAIYHWIPARYNGNLFFGSTSHLTIDFETVVKQGVDYIEETARASYEKYKGTEKEPFIISCLNTIKSMRVYRDRYLDELKDKKGYENNYNNLLNVPFKPAECFYEAVQSIWFTFAFVRLCGNWPGIGRIDVLLGDYLKNDLNNGVLTLDEAREILSHFFIKGCEWITGEPTVSGDAQHYQNIVLGGVDINGNEATNEVTYLVIDILEELGISDFPTTVRLSKNSPQELVDRVSKAISYGGGVFAVYNEDLIIDSLTNYGYSLNEAREFANDGCWEIQIPGRTHFGYTPFDSLCLLQKAINNYDGSVEFASYEELYQAFKLQLRNQIQELGRRYLNTYKRDADHTSWNWNEQTPCTVVSIFERGCIESGLSYNAGGATYTVFSPHIGGLPDVVNSLYAIKKLVFDDKLITFKELCSAVSNNWVGSEEIRQYAQNKYVYFGNDNDEVDSIAAQIIDDFSYFCDEINQLSPIKTPAGVSTFGRQIEWAVNRMATPYGKFKGSILSGNFSATPGTDKEGATAIIKSYCKSDLRKTVSGAALDIKLLPSVVKGEEGRSAIASLLRGFVLLGGHFMQIDVADTEILKLAQENPDDYKTLSVRVSGWNARFVTLSRDWQDMIIQQLGTNI